MRLDKWLWFARFARTRSLAARLCAAGAVTVGGSAATRPSQGVRVGDVVSVPQGRLLHTVRVAALGTRRGPAEEARRLYAPEAPARALSADEPEWEILLGDDGDSRERTASK